MLQAAALSQHAWPLRTAVLAQVEQTRFAVHPFHAAKRELAHLNSSFRERCACSMRQTEHDAEPMMSKPVFAIWRHSILNMLKLQLLSVSSDHCMQRVSLNCRRSSRSADVLTAPSPKPSAKQESDSQAGWRPSEVFLGYRMSSPPQQPSSDAPAPDASAGAVSAPYVDLDHHKRETEQDRLMQPSHPAQQAQQQKLVSQSDLGPDGSCLSPQQHDGSISQKQQQQQQRHGSAESQRRSLQVCKVLLTASLIHQLPGCC